MNVSQSRTGTSLLVLVFGVKSAVAAHHIKQRQGRKEINQQVTDLPEPGGHFPDKQVVRRLLGWLWSR